MHEKISRTLTPSAAVGGLVQDVLPAPQQHRRARVVKALILQWPSTGRQLQPQPPYFTSVNADKFGPSK